MKTLNEKHFSFSVEPQRVKKEIMAEYESYVAKKKKTEYERMFISMVKQKIKDARQKLVITHLSSGIKKSFVADETADKQPMLREVVALVQAERERRRTEIQQQNKKFDGATYQTIGGVFIQPNLINEIGKRCVTHDPLREKLPRKPRAHYVGVELECNFNPAHNVSSVAAAFKNAGLARYVQIGEDGSCGGAPNVKGLEVRCLFEETNFIEPLGRICALLRELGYKVDASCGTHVHLDMRNRDVKRAYANLFRVQLLLRKFLDFSRKRNIYCVKNRFESYDEHMENAVGRDSRRCGINTHSYEKYKTLEIRMHQGTLDEKKLASWIKLLLQIVNYNTTLEKTVHTLKQAKNMFGMDEGLFKDLAERLKSRGA